MNWYYANTGQVEGPVTEEEFQSLIRSGTIFDETLVWKEGMNDWLPYRDVGKPGQTRSESPVRVRTAPATSSPSHGSAAPGVRCHECGQHFAHEDVIYYGKLAVCARCKPVFVQRLKEGGPLSGDMVYGGFWIRLLAKILDGFILGIPMVILGFIIGASAISADPQQTSMSLSISANILFYSIGAAYTIFFVGYFGATPGKMICRLKIVTADGDTVSYLRATGRYFAEILSGMICYIGYLLAPFDDQKRTLHDHICNTRVIRIDR